MAYASSAVTTIGNMVATDPLTIDLSDQAKVLSFKFNYQAAVNPTNGNFSGGALNSFGVAAWDITNNSWLGVQGAFNLTQISGVGQSAGTFQTNFNTTSIRLVFYNVNASLGAITVLLDDFFVGPQIASVATSGPVGEIISHGSLTPPANHLFCDGSAVSRTTFSDLFSVIGVSYGAGDSSTTFNIPDLRGIFARGSGTQTISAINYSKTIGVKSGDTEQAHLHTNTHSHAITDVSHQHQSGVRQNSSGLGNQSVPLDNGSGSVLTIAWGDVRFTGITGTNNYLGNTGSATVADGANGTPRLGSETAPASQGVAYHIRFKSDATFSADADSRVVAGFANAGPNLPDSTATIITGLVTQFDTHAGFQTNGYVIPVTGFYLVSSMVNISTQTLVGGVYEAYITKNGGTIPNGVDRADLNTTALLAGAGQNFTFSPSGLISAKAGDLIQVVALQQSGGSRPCSASLSVFKVSGSAVPLATDTVAAVYNNASSQSIPNNVVTQITNWTKETDSHNAFNAVSGLYTVPISGRYAISAYLVYQGGPVVGTEYDLTLSVNGTVFRQASWLAVGSAGSFTPTTPINALVSLKSGDTVFLSSYQSSGASKLLNPSGLNNYINIARIGN
jgi:microcystin-dependent protein